MSEPAPTRCSVSRVHGVLVEALQLGASRSDIANDVKNGHCTLDGDSMGQKRREQLECERPAKQQRIDAPVLPSENGTPGTEGTQTGSSPSSLPGTSSQGSGSGLKTEKAPLQEVDLSFAKLDGKPIKFVKRTMGEARRLLSPEGLAEAEKSGYKFCLKDNENLSKWLVQLKDLNPDGKLVADLQKHSLDAQIDLELILPDGFPMEPPFARVVYPQLRGGYVFERGGICFEPLTQKGWVPSMTLPALAIAIKGIFDYGEVRVAGVGDKATRTVKHYTEEGARKDVCWQNVLCGGIISSQLHISLKGQFLDISWGYFQDQSKVGYMVIWNDLIELQAFSGKEIQKNLTWQCFDSMLQSFFNETSARITLPFRLRIVEGCATQSFCSDVVPLTAWRNVEHVLKRNFL